VIVRIHGRVPLGAKVYALAKLRCNLCLVIFTAPPPEGVGEKKYDATAGAKLRHLELHRPGLRLERAGVVARPRVLPGLRALVALGAAELIGLGIEQGVQDPYLVSELEALVDSSSRGDPESPLRWTIKSLRRLSMELGSRGHQVSHVVVAHLLRDLGFSLQANRKVREGGTHPDRNLQFEHINRQVKGRLRRGDPVISVDTKKKELVGSFKNAGREWHPMGKPPEVNVYDFVDPELGKAIPYGVYDIARNEGWVSVGVDHDTAQFSVATIELWWRRLGTRRYPKSRRLLIVADGGGSNGYRTRLWKVELQKLADKTGLVISVCHLPPGTSKWNKIEHRLFSFKLERKAIARPSHSCQSHREHNDDDRTEGARLSRHQRVPRQHPGR
jgi:hypothetical protein